MILYIILALLALPITYYITSYNGLKSREIQTEASFAGIDVALSKRYSLINNLVETVKGYAKHERDTLSLMTQLRNVSKEDLESFNATLSDSKSQVMILVESYPEIKADEHYRHLQKALVDCEEHLQAARRLHNRNVAEYNTYIQMTPRNLIPKIKAAKLKPYFEAQDLERTTNVDFE